MMYIITIYSTTQEANNFCYFVETEIGLYLPRSEVAEDGGVLEVCVQVTSPRLSCPIVFPFEMIFTTTAGTACKH